MPDKPIIAVFGSSQPLPGSPVYEEAFHVGYALGRRGWTVASGGYRGIMEAVSKGAKNAGGETIGITTAYFAEKGVHVNPYVDTELQQPTYTDRLLKLAGVADGYVIMRGGSGTLNEFFHVWELVKNGSLPRRPIILYGPHWPRIMEFLTAELNDEAAFSQHIGLISYASDPDTLIGLLDSAFADHDTSR